MSEEKKISDSNFSTGAVRSADVSHLDFCSAPLLGFLAVLRVSGGGGAKYGRFNYMQGMPLHETLNHIAVHLIRYILGDRSEPHLAKVAWGAMVADQTAALNPELCEPHMLSPGATLTPAMMIEMERGKAERDAKRQAGEFEKLFNWTLRDMPEVQEIIKQRYLGFAKEIMDDMEGFANQAASENPEIPVKPREVVDRYMLERSARLRGKLAKRVASDSMVSERHIETKPRYVTASGRYPAGYVHEKRPEAVHVDPEGSHPVDHAYRTKETVDPAWSPGSTNAQVYGNPTRTEHVCGQPTPQEGEYWVEYDDGTRAYFKKITPSSDGGDHMGGCPPMP